jgi:hypothetical protein
VEAQNYFVPDDQMTVPVDVSNPRQRFFVGALLAAPLFEVAGHNKQGAASSAPTSL